MELDIVNTLIGSGISGVALYMFWSLMKTEIRDLKISIDKLSEQIGKKG